MRRKLECLNSGTWWCVFYMYVYCIPVHSQIQNHTRSAQVCDIIKSALCSFHNLYLEKTKSDEFRLRMRQNCYMLYFLFYWMKNSCDNYSVSYSLCTTWNSFKSLYISESPVGKEPTAKRYMLLVETPNWSPNYLGQASTSTCFMHFSSYSCIVLKAFYSDIFVSKNITSISDM